jgi:hypothetical protein
MACAAQVIATKAISFIDCLAGGAASGNLGCLMNALKGVTTGKFKVGYPTCFTFKDMMRAATRHLTSEEEFMIQQQNPGKTSDEYAVLYAKYAPKTAILDHPSAVLALAQEEDRHQKHTKAVVMTRAQADSKAVLAQVMQKDPSSDEELVVVGQQGDSVRLASPRSKVLVAFDDIDVDTELISAAAPSCTSDGLGFTFCKSLLNNMLNLKASATITGGFFIQADVPDQKVEFGFQQAGLQLHFNAVFSLNKQKSKKQTWDLVFTNGKAMCTTPTQAAKCRPARLIKKMVMAGPVPIIIVVYAQLVGQATIEATLQGSFKADFTYNQFIGFTKLSVGVHRGQMFKHVDFAYKPTITKSFSASASGSIVGSIQVGPKITAIVNGATMITSPYVKLIITGRFHAAVNGLLLQNTAEVAVQDKAKTGGSCASAALLEILRSPLLLAQLHLRCPRVCVWHALPLLATFARIPKLEPRIVLQNPSSTLILAQKPARHVTKLPSR